MRRHPLREAMQQRMSHWLGQYTNNPNREQILVQALSAAKCHFDLAVTMTQLSVRFTTSPIRFQCILIEPGDWYVVLR
jgi:hypothetical protein